MGHPVCGSGLADPALEVFREIRSAQALVGGGVGWGGGPWTAESESGMLWAESGREGPVGDANTLQ